MSWQTGNPPNRGNYLVTCQSPGSGPYVQIIGYHNGWMDDRKVLAWQPLPGPYRVEEAHWPQGHGNPDDLLQAKEGHQG